ncbi:MAG: hypothetical protein KGL39_37180 [Patescibacteria group bacterium]|nr:hypothetical protein [Patescibacteria group bacterium]
MIVHEHLILELHESGIPIETAREVVSYIWPAADSVEEAYTTITREIERAQGEIEERTRYRDAMVRARDRFAVHASVAQNPPPLTSERNEYGQA